MLWYTRNSIIPHTQAICLAGLAEHDLYRLCTDFATQLATPAKSGTMSVFMPMCQEVCFHSCDGASDQDRDGFFDCRNPACADTNCRDFLLRFVVPHA